MQDLTVLLTSCGGPGSPGVIASLRAVSERKITIIGCDMDENAPGLYLVDKPYVVPPIKSSDYLDTLFSISRKEAIDVLLPSSSSELMKLAGARRRFEEAGITLVCPPLEVLSLVLDKGRCYEFARKEGVAVPEYRLPRNIGEFGTAVRELGYPQTEVCFKPVSGSGTRGFTVLKEDITGESILDTKFTSMVSDLEGIRKILGRGKFPELIVMEYLTGEEYSNDLLVNRGEPLFIVPRRRVKIESGISRVAIAEYNPEIIESCQRISRAFSLHGNANIQLKYSKEGQPKLIEINPRVSGTIVLATASGVNLPYSGIKLALGEAVPAGGLRYGVRMTRYLKEIFVAEGKSWQL